MRPGGEPRPQRARKLVDDRQTIDMKGTRRPSTRIFCISQSVSCAAADALHWVCLALLMH